MTAPLIVEVTRGPLVESRHQVVVSVVDADGAVRVRMGDVTAPVFPRSAVKAIQALPLVETGAADAYGFGDADLALACSSHSGEPGHVERASAILMRAGLSSETLECGGHWSTHARVMRDQVAQYGATATPPAVCNNCSGKHSGFVCTAIHRGEDPRGYVLPDHAVQRRVRAALEQVTGSAHAEDVCGTDGCSIPTYAVPLDALALGFARMATGTGLSADRARAAKRIMKACMAEPWHVAGTKRFCTTVMEIGKGRIFAKTGAEGVFCGAIPDLGVGIALKVEDGATRAAEAAMAAVLAHLLDDEDMVLPLDALAALPLRNWRGVKVGTTRVVGLG